MKALLMPVLFLSVYATAQAQPLEIKECYVRNYTKAHLVKNPGQIASRIKFAFATDEYGSTYGLVSVTKKGPKAFTASYGGGCYKAGIGWGWGCSLDSDHGRFIVSPEVLGEITLLVSDYLVLENENVKTGEVSEIRLEEGSTNGKYRLYRVAKKKCSDLI